MKSPRWNIEEAKIVLLLYLRKGWEWQNTITNKTTEVKSLSKIIRALDFVPNPHPASFRSESAIRLKLANFKSLDPSYKKRSLSNVSVDDRKLWNDYSNNLDLLVHECRRIISNHLNAEIRNEETSFITYILDDDKHYEINVDDFQRVIDQLKSLKTEYKSDCDYLIVGLSQIIETYSYKDSDDYVEHAGVNLKGINKTAKAKKKQTNDVIKIGEHVRQTMQSLISDGLLDVNIINNLMSLEWCRATLHINHPMLVKINKLSNIKSQIIDANGYVRYWTKTWNINGDDYCVCKEWYESNRVYFDDWVNSVISVRKINLDEMRTKSIVQYIFKLDESNVYIREADVLRKYGDDSRSVFEYLLELGVLQKYQNKNNAYVVEDYDLLFSIMNETEKYCKEKEK